MMVSNCLRRAGSSIRINVSIALRIDDSGFFSSCATSAANCSVASMRAHNALAESDTALASSPTSSRRASNEVETLPVRPLPSRMSLAASASRRIGRAMVSDKYHDSSTVSARARPNSAMIDSANGLQAFFHLARLAGQQHDADGAFVALHRLGDGDPQPVIDGAADIRRHFAAVAGALQPHLLLHVGLPVRPARAGRDIDGGDRAAVRQQRQHEIVDLADKRQDRAAIDRRQRRPVRPRRPALARLRVGDDGAVRRINLGARIGCRIGQPAQQRTSDFRHQMRIVRVGRQHRALADRAGVNLRLFAQRGDLGFQQTVLVLIQIQQRHDQQRQRQGVDQQNPPQQRRHPALAKPPERYALRSAAVPRSVPPSGT